MIDIRAVPVGQTIGRRRVDADERLVARALAGDDGAFEEIYERYHGVLLAFCRHLLGSREEAEDALQGCFASAYRMLSSGVGAARLKPWLFTIARNRCLSVLRARRERLAAGAELLDVPDLDGLPAKVQRRADLRELVHELQRLPEDQRTALVLFELGGCAHDEIAAILGVRREKVKALVFQAREGLLRARRARDTPCASVREELAMLRGPLPRRGLLRAHVERCPGCATFEAAVRRQRAALGLVLPIVPTAGLKASVLGAAIGGGSVAGMSGGAGVVATGAGVGAGTIGGGLGAAGGITGTGLAAGGAGGAVAAGAGGIAGALEGIGGGAAVAKVLTVVALAGGAGAGGASLAHHLPVAPVVAPALTHAERPSHPARHRAPAAPVPAPAPAVSAPGAAGGDAGPETPASVTTAPPATAAAPPAAVTPAATSAGKPADGSTAAPAAEAVPAAAVVPAADGPAPASTTDPAPATGGDPAPSAAPTGGDAPAPTDGATTTPAPADPAPTTTTATPQPTDTTATTSAAAGDTTDSSGAATAPVTDAATAPATQ